jgi:protein-S-isoprenylcysteine O-methyltransferase Ste14
MIGLRVYLLAGLVAHKLVWEVLKRRDAVSQPPPATAPLTLIKAAKLVILLGLVAQTMLPDIFPITTAAWPLRLSGVLLYTVGLCVAILGRIGLGRNWSDIEAPRILRQHEVVANGVYRYIRHPIYVGDLLLLLGLQLSLNSWLVVSVGFVIPFVLHRAVREERALSEAVPGYDAYCMRTKRFFPFVV